MKNIINNRFSLFRRIFLFYLIISFVVRLALFIWSINSIEVTGNNLIRIFGLGMLYDIGVATFFTLPYAFFLLIVPSILVGSWFDRFATYFITSVTLFLMLFGFAGEFPFWEEFSNRYNFIAVDYLIYTYEVVQNINESYPIPLILLVLFGVIVLLFIFFSKKDVLKTTFSSRFSFSQRIPLFLVLILIGLLHLKFVNNKLAEWSDNTYHNELSKNGTYSLFSAYISNELDYNKFYKTIPTEKAYSLVKKELKQTNQIYTSRDDSSLQRLVKNDSTITPNIILVTIESLSASFLESFGNYKGLTPNIDSLAKESVFFTNIFATGTRTVRGMEALTLSTPPTPGHSIVRRPNNEHLFSIATVLRQKKYHLDFIYGGDGYFDNMNYFFGNQGFDIVDRDRGNPLSDNIETNRYPIPDSEVTFENAWGICDEDLYKQSLKRADEYFNKKKPFFQFIMTTSNHKPYTFSDGKIDLPKGNRSSAVKYTDYALGKFIKEAKNKPWFKNTIFVIVADHCASSAGKWEINVEKHHIPAMIYNSKTAPQKVDKTASQIDVMPTLFGLLDWSYKTQLYGKDILKMEPKEERALLGNYRTLGLLKNGLLTQLDDHQGVSQYKWNNTSNTLIPVSTDVDSLINITVSYYQTASERFKKGKLKESNKIEK